MRRRRFVKQPVANNLVSRGGLMFYVTCPNPECGDPVGGRIPQPPEELKLACPHCKQTFSFAPGEVLRGLVVYDPIIDRWKLQTVANQLGI